MAERVYRNDLSTGMPAKLKPIESLRKLAELGAITDWRTLRQYLQQCPDEELADYDTVPEHTQGTDIRTLQCELEVKNQYIDELKNQVKHKETHLAEKNEKIAELESRLTKSQNDKGHIVATSNNVRQQKAMKDIEKLREKLEQAENLNEKRKSVILQLQSSRKQEKENYESFQRTVNEIFEENDQLKRDMQKTQLGKQELQKLNETLQQDFQVLKNEHEQTQNRLSRLMSARVTDNNPDIADLSDVNRPNKLAEMYQELYDNQWSDAFEYFTSEKDEKRVKFLLDVLKRARCFCEEEADIQTKELNSALFKEQSQQPLPDIVRAELKGIKKNMIPHNLDVLQQRFLRRYIRAESRRIPEIVSYAQECVKVCWIMALNDPPIVFAQEVKYGEMIDTSLFKHYTVKGDRCDYVVWPALIMSEGGALVTKGVAQALRVVTPTNYSATSHHAESSSRPQTAPASGNLYIHGMSEDDKRVTIRKGDGEEFSKSLRGTSSNRGHSYSTMPDSLKDSVHGSRSVHIPVKEGYRDYEQRNVSGVRHSQTTRNQNHSMPYTDYITKAKYHY